MTQLEVYDHLEGKETLVIYMSQSGGDRIRLPGGIFTQDRNTRILRDAYDYRPIHQRQVKIGERLMCSATIPGGGVETRRIIPTDWVVTEVETYEASIDSPGFREVVIAYCDRKPLSLEEFKAATYDNNVKVSVESFGGDEEAYQRFTNSKNGKNYVQID